LWSVKFSGGELWFCRLFLLVAEPGGFFVAEMGDFARLKYFVADQSRDGGGAGWRWKASEARDPVDR